MVTAIQDWFRNSLGSVGFLGNPTRSSLPEQMMLGKMGWKATLKTSFCFRSLDARQSGDGEQALAFKPRASVRSICRPATAWDQTNLYQISILLPSRKGKLDLLYFSFTSSVFSQFSDTFSNQTSLALQSCLPLSSAFSNLRQSAAKFRHASPNTCEDPLLFCIPGIPLVVPTVQSRKTNQSSKKCWNTTPRQTWNSWDLRSFKLQASPHLESLVLDTSLKKDPKRVPFQVIPDFFLFLMVRILDPGNFFQSLGGNSGHPNFAVPHGRLLRKLIQLGRTRM